LFKAQVAAQIGREPHEIMLKRQGERPFNDKLTLEDYGISNGVQLDLYVSVYLGFWGTLLTTLLGRLTLGIEAATDGETLVRYIVWRWRLTPTQKERLGKAVLVPWRGLSRIALVTLEFAVAMDVKALVNSSYDTPELPQALFHECSIQNVTALKSTCS